MSSSPARAGSSSSSSNQQHPEAALDPQQVAATIERISRLGREEEEESSDTSSSSSTTIRREEHDLDDHPLPWDDHTGEDGSASLGIPLLALLHDDAELITAALESLDLAVPGGVPPNNNNNNTHIADAAGSWMLDEPLPELELLFSGQDDEDDPLWQGNIWSAFDDDVAYETTAEEEASPTQTVVHPPDKNDALDLLEQLEHLTLWDDNYDENPVAENGDNSTTTHDPWLHQPIHAPPPFDEERDLEPIPLCSSALSDPSLSWWSYCHLCDASRAEPPLLHNNNNNSNEQAWALAAAWAQQDDWPGEVQFWRQQLEYLQDSQLLLPDPLLELLEFGTNDQEQDELSDQEENRHETTMSGNHAPTDVAISPQALTAAEPFLNSFHAKQQQQSAPVRTCLGHQERVLGCEFSPCGQFLATASQDSTVRVWSTAHHKLLSTLNNAHSRKHECLRVTWASHEWIHATWTGDGSSTRDQRRPHVLATGGADGIVHVWVCDDPFQDTWVICATLDHSTYRHVTSNKRGIASGGAALDSIQEEEEQSTNKEVEEETEDDDDDKPQIYAMQFIDHWKLPNHVKPPDKSDQPMAGSSCSSANSFLLTSSDDHVHLWEVDRDTKSIQSDDSRKLQLREVMSLYFGPLQNAGYGVRVTHVTDQSIWSVGAASNSRHNPSDRDEHQQQHDTLCPNNSSSNNRFGGDRNPHNLIFVFDASYCANNGLLGVALSDGSVRLVNGRCVCLAVLQLPGSLPAHLTSFDWDASGTRLATTVATGHLIVWGIETTTTTNTARSGHSLENGPAEGFVRTSCLAVLEGGHTARRPLYGARFLGRGSDVSLLLSWGSDGRLCLWDGLSQGELHAPLAVLRHDEEYPLFAVSVTNPRPMTEDEVDAHCKKGSDDPEETDSTSDPNSALMMMTIAIAGGGSEESFLGIPVYMQDIWNMRGGILLDDELGEKDAKRLKCTQ